jgi:hypothetical protein
MTRLARLALAAVIALGTLAGVVGTSVLALVLAAPRAFTTGLEPLPEGAVLGWLVSRDVSTAATTGLLWMLGATTLLLAAAVAAGARRIWLAYAPWALVGGMLTTYALIANWELAREAGMLAFAIGAAWSVAVALVVARVGSAARARGGRAAGGA